MSGSDWLPGAVPVPGQITLILDLHGLGGPLVDAALGVPEPTVDQWESGELVPTRAQMLRLALLTGCPVERFYMPMRGNSHTFVCAIPDGEPSVAGHILPGQLLLDDLAEEEPG